MQVFHQGAWTAMWRRRLPDYVASRCGPAPRTMSGPSAQAPSTGTGKTGAASRIGTTDPLNAAWGSSATDVWAGGGNGALLPSDGSAWAVFPARTNKTIYSLWGGFSSDVYAVDGSSSLFAIGRSVWAMAAEVPDVRIWLHLGQLRP